MFGELSPLLVDQILPAVLVLAGMIFGTNLVTEVIKIVSRVIGKPLADKEAWWKGIQGRWSQVVAIIIAFVAVPFYGLDFLAYFEGVEFDPGFSEMLNQLIAAFGASWLHGKFDKK